MKRLSPWHWALVAGIAAGCAGDADDPATLDAATSADSAAGTPDAADAGPGGTDAHTADAADAGGPGDAGTGGDTPDAAGDTTGGADAGGEDVVVYPTGPYAATIRRTSFGVPHVTADDWGSLGYGEGYALAQDHVCTLADQIVRANSRRAALFGPGPGDRHVNSDFGMLALGIRKRAKAAWAELEPEAQAFIDGYAAGYNRYLADTGAAGLPEPCKGADWVAPITHDDLVTYYLMLGLYGSGLPLLDYIATAQPPTAEGAKVLPMTSFPDFRRLENLGSNGWGIGKERTASGGGMVAVNPHFPWEGERRFWEVHLTIPGTLNAYGAALVGTPFLQIGFNGDVAWTHTVSAAKHFTFYRVTMPEGDPTSYVYEGETRPMESETFTIQVKAEGGLEERTRTMYRTHHGPMLNVPPIGWTDALAVAYRDANEGNVRLVEQWRRFVLSHSVADMEQALRDVHGIPWVNTMAADKAGKAFYSDTGGVPNLSPGARADWEAALDGDAFTGLAWANGIILLDGSKAGHEWADAPGTPPGVAPFDDTPHLVRDDFVANANDSYWLTNPAAPLEGYGPQFGDEGTPRSPRTRMNLRMLTEQGADGASGEDGKFTLEELQDAMLGGRALLEELLRDQVLTRCEGATTVDVKGETVDVGAACGILAAWDGRLRTDSVGAVLWRETLGNFTEADFYDAGKLFAVPFDPQDPVGTPRDLVAKGADEPDPILEAIAKAVLRLAEAAYTPYVSLGEAQYTMKGVDRIAIPGGSEVPEGAFNIVSSADGNGTTFPSMPVAPTVNGTTGLTEDGYPIRYGSSIVMAIDLAPDGPRARALLTYSESADPASPHSKDQTQRFTGAEWREVLFTEDAIAADPNLVETTITTDSTEN